MVLYKKVRHQQVLNWIGSETCRARRRGPINPSVPHSKAHCTSLFSLKASLLYILNYFRFFLLRHQRHNCSIKLNVPAAVEARAVSAGQQCVPLRCTLLMSITAANQGHINLKQCSSEWGSESYRSPPHPSHPNVLPRTDCCERFCRDWLIRFVSVVWYQVGALSLGHSQVERRTGFRWFGEDLIFCSQWNDTIMEQQGCNYFLALRLLHLHLSLRWPD